MTGAGDAEVVEVETKRRVEVATERDVEESVTIERDDERGTETGDVEEVVETASAVSKVHLITLFSLPTFLLLTPSPLFSLPK